MWLEEFLKQSHLVIPFSPWHCSVFILFRTILWVLWKPLDVYCLLSISGIQTDPSYLLFTASSKGSFYYTVIAGSIPLSFHLTPQNGRTGTNWTHENGQWVACCPILNGILRFIGRFSRVNAFYFISIPVSAHTIIHVFSRPHFLFQQFPTTQLQMLEDHLLL